MNIGSVVFLSAVLFTACPVVLHAEPNPQEMLAAMDYSLRGSSHDMTVVLDVKTKRWERQYQIRVQMKGLDYAFARVLQPAKSEGQGFLRQETRLWQYLPTAERTILIPPSLMLDDFLGSDFSNDDFVKMSYMAKDYTGQILEQADYSGQAAYHLELLPNPDAPVTYGKLEVWLRAADHLPLRWDFYNEKLDKIRMLEFSEVKTYGDHSIPTVWKMTNFKDPDRSTTVTVSQAAFGTDISDTVFTRQNLEKYP